MAERTVPKFGWLVLLLVLLFVAAAVLVGVHLTNLASRLAETAARENAKRYSEALATVRSRYTSEVGGPGRRPWHHSVG